MQMDGRRSTMVHIYFINKVNINVLFKVLSLHYSCLHLSAILCKDNVWIAQKASNGKQAVSRPLKHTAFVITHFLHQPVHEFSIKF